MYEKITIISHKARIISHSTLLFLLLVSIRLCYLQIICSQNLFERAQRNFLRLESIPAPRGMILDCNGCILAANRPVFSLYWNGQGSRQLTQAHRELINKCQEILSLPTVDEKDIKAIEYAERNRKKRFLYKDLSITQLGKLQELARNCPSISFEKTFKRVYPYENSASHIIGHLARQEDFLYGKAGIELLCNETLRGTPGIMLIGTNEHDCSITKTIVREQVPGKNIRSTIDMNLQKIGESVFPDYYKGALLIMQPDDGAIKTLVSKPDFDPGIFLDRLSSTTWNILQEKQPFLNRALATYPPGSIFKLIGISAALELGVIKEDDTWTCKGFYSYAKRKYWCHLHSGHGKLTTSQAVAHSCNILFFETARRMSVDSFALYANKFGLGEPTGSLFSEKEGLVPTKDWKLACKGEPWWPGETLSVSIGQSFLLVTPLQIARMIGSIFTGKLVTPRILYNEPIQTTPLDIEPKTISFLKESMKAVVTRGTGRQISKVKDIEIYAKTSTAQTTQLGKLLLDSSHLEHGWFVAHIQYKKQQPLVLVILVENAGTSKIPTAIARDFLIEYKKLINEH